MRILTLTISSFVFALAPCAAGQSDANNEPSSSLMVRPPTGSQTEDRPTEPPHALRQVSMFAVAPPQPRSFQKHDLIQIIVREQSEARSRQEVDTEKKYALNGKISAFPNFQLSDLLQFQLQGGSGTNMPEVRVDGNQKFEGDGDYRRSDDFTARITAEVIEVLPNGNLVIEARTFIKTDREEQTMKVTGVCRPQDVTAANTVLSNQIHNLTVEKVHNGELPRAAERGIIAKVLDFVFAF